jgi:hypothetical protein
MVNDPDEIEPDPSDESLLQPPELVDDDGMPDSNL